MFERFYAWTGSQPLDGWHRPGAVDRQTPVQAMKARSASPAPSARARPSASRLPPRERVMSIDMSGQHVPPAREGEDAGRERGCARPSDRRRRCTRLNVSFGLNHNIGSSGHRPRASTPARVSGSPSCNRFRLGSRRRRRGRRPQCQIEQARPRPGAGRAPRASQYAAQFVPQRGSSGSPRTAASSPFVCRAGRGVAERASALSCRSDSGYIEQVAGKPGSRSPRTAPPRSHSFLSLRCPSRSRTDTPRTRSLRHRREA